MVGGLLGTTDDVGVMELLGIAGEDISGVEVHFSSGTNHMWDLILDTRECSMFVVHQLEGGVVEARQGVHFRR